MNYKKIATVLFIIILISSIFLIEYKREEAREMKVKEYLINLLNKIKYDESGQWGGAPSSVWQHLTKPATKPKDPAWWTYPGSYTEYFKGTGTQPLLQQKETQPPQVTQPQTPAQVYYGGGGGGGVSMPSYSMPSYNAPAISLNVPSFGWSPTAAQRGEWETGAARKTAMIYDPQREELARQLERYRGSVGEERGRMNPMYDIQSRAVANIIENTVKQALVEDAIRRGAETGGELPRQVAGAGRLEVQQRREIETERGQAEATLSRALLEHERQTGEQITSLTQLQGLHGEQIRAELENTARDWAFRETGSKFEAELAVASLRNAIAAAEYQAQYQQAVFKAQQGQQEWERGFSERQFGLQEQQAAYSQAMAGRGDPLATLKEEIMRQQYEASKAAEAREAELHKYYMGTLPGGATSQPTYGGATRNIGGTNYPVDRYGQPISFSNTQELWAAQPGQTLTPFQ